MYLPENHAQMFDILSVLRVYANQHSLPALAEQLDDAIVIFAAEVRRNAIRKDGDVRTS